MNLTMKKWALGSGPEMGQKHNSGQILCQGLRGFRLGGQIGGYLSIPKLNKTLGLLMIRSHLSLLRPP